MADEPPVQVAPGQAVNQHLCRGGVGGHGHIVLVAQVDNVAQVLFQLVGGGVVEEQHHVNLVVGDACADLLRAALGVGQEELNGQAGGLRHLTAGIAGGADGVLGEDAAVGNAELDHQFFFVIVAHQGNIHADRPFYGVWRIWFMDSSDA